MPGSASEDNQTDDRDERIGESVVTNIEFGPPKYVASIPEAARRAIGATDLDYTKGEKIEKVVVQAELTVTDVYVKDIGGDE